MEAINEVNPVFRVLDWALAPLMYVLGGCKLDSIQETHYWHCQRVSAPHEVDYIASIIIRGDDSSSFANALTPLPLFHIPLIGGWRNYAILEVQSTVATWHVGWIHLVVPAGSRPRSHVQRLPIAERNIRVLKHPHGYVTKFFAVDSCGNQIPVKCVGEGRLGDNRYKNIRLF
jgi:hypothetical protein